VFAGLFSDGFPSLELLEALGLLGHNIERAVLGLESTVQDLIRVPAPDLVTSPLHQFAHHHNGLIF